VEKSQKKDWASKDKVKWFKVALKSGEQTTKEVSGNVWHWCPNHKSWHRHTASECKGINFKPKQETNSNRNVSEATANPQLRLIQAMTAVTMFGYHSVEKETEETYLNYESGLGKPIKVDNCTTCSISNDKKDFVGKLEPLNNTIKGIGGSIEGVSKGTIKWKIVDDSGMHLILILSNSVYVPSSTSCHSTGHLKPTITAHSREEHGVLLTRMKSIYFGIKKVLQED
jgi:hypothetical protein